MKRNNFFNVASLLAVLLVLFSACDSSDESASTTNNESQTSQTSKKSTDDSSENSSVLESTEEDTTKKDESTSEESDTDQVNDISSEEPSENSDSNLGNKEDKETLSQYSSKQIEYARVWLQLGPNQDVEELYVRHIPAGEPLNFNDKTSASYPEEVIQLAGPRLVDGSVTYSGNGDGTINVYKVPLRWDGRYPAGENFYTDIIENTKLVYVDTGDNEEIIELINKMNIH